MSFNEFLSTMVGSWFKVWASAMLGLVLVILNDAEQVLWSWQTLHSMGILSGTALIPMIINYLNPQDPRYGKESKKDVEIVKKDG